MDNTTIHCIYYYYVSEAELSGYMYIYMPIYMPIYIYIRKMAQSRIH